MNYAQAIRRAELLVEDMRPHCERVVVAGSIRRHKTDGIKDVEIVAIPRWESARAGLFAEDVTKENALWKWAQERSVVEWIKPGKTDPEKAEIKPDGKYWRGLFGDGIKLDLFLCTPVNWGIILMIRTGPSDYSRKMVTLKSLGGWLKDELEIRVRDGHVQKLDGTIIPTTEEADVYKLWKYKFVEPEDRK